MKPPNTRKNGSTVNIHPPAELFISYRYDERQEVAKAYSAPCTPDIFLFDKDLHLVYRGRLDDSRPANDIPVSGEYLRSAIDQLLSGGKITVEQKLSLGCNIKWKPGNELEYSGFV